VAQTLLVAVAVLMVLVLYGGSADGVGFRSAGVIVVLVVVVGLFAISQVVTHMGRDELHCIALNGKSEKSTNEPGFPLKPSTVTPWIPGIKGLVGSFGF